MASSSDYTTRITDMTRCSICLQQFVVPKLLPCGHTFCLGCLQSLPRRSCPVCRNAFACPSGGLARLPANISMQDLLELARDMERNQQSRCPTHSGEEVKLYCHDCKTNICLMCLAVQHQNHSREEIAVVAPTFQKQLDEDMKPLKELMADIRHKLDHLEIGKIEISDSADVSRSAIREEGEKVKQRVDKEVETLIGELESSNSAVFREVNRRMGMLNTDLSTLDDFTAQYTMLKTSGQASDITRTGEDMHARAERLLRSTDVTPGDYSVPRVRFSPTSAETRMVGRVQTEENEALFSVVSPVVHSRSYKRDDTTRNTETFRWPM